MLCSDAQAVESMLGSADGNVLERIAKIMSYMRPALVGKSGKRLKRKEKLRMLADGGEAPLNGHLHGSLKPPPPQSAPVIIPGILRFTLSSYCGPHTSLTSVPPYCICQAILHILDLCPALLHLSGHLTHPRPLSRPAASVRPSFSDPLALRAGAGEAGNAYKRVVTHRQEMLAGGD